jgi:hypothetical protein
MRAARRLLATLVALALASAIGGCALFGSGHSHTSTTAGRPGAPTSRTTASPPASSLDSGAGAHGVSSSPLRPVGPADADPAAQVLRRYATLYGNLCSCARAPITLDQLARLATPALATQLHRAALSARAAIARGLPEPARAIGTIATLELAPPQAGTETGLVVLTERTAIAGGGTTAPAPVVYAARLTLTPAGWRVATFVPSVRAQPPPPTAP